MRTDESKRVLYSENIALQAARLYEGRRREYLRARQAILNSSGTSSRNAARNSSRRAGGRSTEARAARLEALERLQWVREMRAVEHARDRIGAGMPEEMQKALRDAIMLNVTSGRKHPFERLYTIGVSRRGFYRHRAAFLADLAAEIEAQKQRRHSAKNEVL